MAPVAQTVSQTPQPMHLSQSSSTPSPFKRRASKGQAAEQSEQSAQIARSMEAT